MTNAQPLISLILCVKNGMPHLPQALESVAAQTYRPFEVIVQDACSTDGSLEYLRSVRHVPGMDILSEPDGGIGDGYNRAVRRCQGEIIGSIDADNLLEPGVLEAVARRFAEHPQAAAIYGAARMIDAAGKVLWTWTPPQFDRLGALTCDVLPPFGQSFVSRRVCGQELRFDESLKTCADYDLWLRLSHLPIVQVDDVVGSVRQSNKSMSCLPETYDQFCRDKLTALRNHLTQTGQPAEGDLFRLVAGGIHAWAAECVQRIEGRSERCERLIGLAAEYWPHSPVVQRLKNQPPPANNSAASAAPSPASSSAPVDETAVLLTRFGRMLHRNQPLSEAELVEATCALNDCLNSSDLAGYVRQHASQLPNALVPLLLYHMAGAWQEKNALLAEVLEHLYGIVTAARETPPKPVSDPPAAPAPASASRPADSAPASLAPAAPSTPARLKPPKPNGSPRGKLKQVVVVDPSWAYEIYQSYYMDRATWRLKPGVVMVQPPNMDVSFQINWHGFKGEEIDFSKKLVAVWGDSVVFSVRRGWVELINESFPKHQFINAGVEGRTLDQICAHAREANEEIDIAHNVIFPGWHSRREPEKVRQLLREAADRLPGVALCTVPISLSPRLAAMDLTKYFNLNRGGSEDLFMFAGNIPYSVENARQLVREFLEQNQVVREVAAERGLPLIDLYEKFYVDDLDHFREDFFDVGHPRERAFPKFKKVFSEYLKPVLN